MTARVHGEHRGAFGAPTTTTPRRIDLLDGAVALADQGTSVGIGNLAGLGHVSLRAVADAAGVTRSALYHLWPAKHEFHDDLARHLLWSDRSGPLMSATPTIGDVLGPGGRATIDDGVQDALVADRTALFEIALVGHASSGPRRIPAERRQSRARLFRSRVAAMLRAAARCGVPGIGTPDLATALTIPGQGLPITARLVAPHHLTVGHGVPSTIAGHTLFGTLQLAIGQGLTRPGQPSSGHGTTQGFGRAEPGEPLFVTTGRRREYLDIGAGIARAPAHAGTGIGHTLEYLSRDRLAHALGVSKRTLGNVWHNQAALRLDLMVHLMLRDRDELIRTVEGLAASPGPEPKDALLDLGDRVQEHATSQRDRLRFFAFAPYLDDADVAERVRAAHRPTIGRLSHALDALVRRTRRRPRPGITVDQLATALLVIHDGTHRLVRTDPDAISADVGRAGQAHSVTGLTTAAVFDALTEQADDDPRVTGYAELVG